MKKFLCVCVMISLTMVIGLVGCASTDAGLEEGDPDHEVTMLMLHYDSMYLHNFIIKSVLEGAYGYKVNEVTADTTPGLVALENGDCDFLLEAWIDSKVEWHDEALRKGSIVDMGSTYSNPAVQGLFIPSYMDESIVTIDDYIDYCRKCDSSIEFVNVPSSWNTYTIIGNKIEGYGIRDINNVVESGSQSVMDTEILSLYIHQEDFCCYGYTPTAIMSRVELRLLKEPDYSEEIWNTTNLCDYPPSTVLKIANAEFYENHKELCDLILMYSLDTSLVDEFLLLQADSGREFPDIAREWMAGHDEWHYLVGEDDSMVDQVLNYLEVGSH